MGCSFYVLAQADTPGQADLKVCSTQVALASQQSTSNEEIKRLLQARDGYKRGMLSSSSLCLLRTLRRQNMLLKEQAGCMDSLGAPYQQPLQRQLAKIGGKDVPR